MAVKGSSRLSWPENVGAFLHHRYMYVIVHRVNNVPVSPNQPPPLRNHREPTMATSLLPICFGIALETTRVVTDVVFPTYINIQSNDPSTTTEWLGFYAGGAFLATLSLSTSFQPPSNALATLSFLTIASAYAVLALTTSMPRSTQLFLTTVTLIGLGTSAASVSSSALVATVQQARNYRLAGIVSKLSIPVIVASFTQSKHQLPILFSTISAVMAVLACVLFKCTPVHQTTKKVNNTPNIITYHQWWHVVCYCTMVSLPNIAGGIVRALLHTRFLSNTDETASASVAYSHSLSQTVSIPLLMCTAWMLDTTSAAPTFAWITIIVQALVMALAASIILCSNATWVIVLAFVLFRAVEETAKLPNTMILLSFVGGGSKTSGGKGKAVRFVAAQKVIGSVLKMITSVASTRLIRVYGTSSGLVMAVALCLVGASGLLCVVVYGGGGQRERSAVVVKRKVV